MEIPVLSDIVVICALALGVIFVCRRLAIPTIVGFLLTGIFAGPHGLKLVSQVEVVDHLAEIGVVCLLFTIGLELSLKSLSRIKFIVLLGGSFQVVVTLIAGVGLASALGMPLNQSIFFGFLVSLSSTAIVLKIIQQRAETESPHGRISIGILIFQDIIVVPMMLVTPILAGKAEDIGLALLLLVVKAIVVVLATVIAAKWIAPRVLYQVARLGGREIFLLGVILLALGVAWLTSAMGLSLALGAFLAGLIVSESEYSHRALGNVLPFRDLFTSLFFVSIGMLLDIGYVINNPVPLFAVTICIVLLKFIIAGASAILLGFPIRTAVIAGLALSQIGEFSFVLSEAGIGVGLVQPDVYQLFLGVSVITMIATPFLVSFGQSAADIIAKLPMPQRLKLGFRPLEENRITPGLTNHLIIVGFGLNGQHLSQAASVAKIPYVIIELNPDTVRREQLKGQPIFYGDASQEAVLEHVGVKQARILVIVISDPAATKRIIETARRLHPDLYIISRTRFVSEMGALSELGADEVIPEDYEVSTEVLIRVLIKYLIPEEDIERLVDQIRADHYRMLRSLVYPSPTVSDLEIQLSDVDIHVLKVRSGSPATGKSLRELDLRRKYGATVLAIRRDADFIANPSPDEKFQVEDVLVLLGTSDAIRNVVNLIHNSQGRFEPLVTRIT
jgi:monovalent cation:H+ antiporter-2, CPA2 family